MDAYWTGERPEEIPMVPEILYLEDFKKIRSVKNELNYTHILVPGIDMDSVEAISLNLNKSAVAVVADQAEKVKLTIELFITELLNRSAQDIIVVDRPQNPLQKYANEVLYLTEKEEIEQMIDTVHADYQEKVERNALINQPKYLLLHHPKLFFGQLSALHETKLLELVNTGYDKNIYVVIAGEESMISAGFGDLKKSLKQIPQALVQMKASEQLTIATDVKSYGELPLPPDECYYISEGLARKIKVPRLSEV